VLSAQQPLERPELTAAYARCERLAREHYENFPVASRLLPRRMRPHVAAVYAFARVADDFADEDGRPAGERQALLDDWLERLHAAASGVGSAGSAGLKTRPTSIGEAAGAGEAVALDDSALLFLALGNTIRECRLPVDLFEDLLSAFRQDITRTRYETFDELLDYCRRSANPVGRLVLRIAGHTDARMDAASDCVCSALQLANFWQDLERDWDRGRLYVPLEEVRAHAASETDLDGRRMTEPWRNVLAALATRTREMFLRGREVADLVNGRLRLELRLTWLGGWRILERLERQQFDVFGRRPALGAADVPLLLWRAATWRFGARTIDQGSGIRDQGSGGPKPKAQGPRPNDQGSGIRDQGSGGPKPKAQGPRPIDQGSGIGDRGHQGPGTRDQGLPKSGSRRPESGAR
jgi:phytoene synthase